MPFGPITDPIRCVFTGSAEATVAYVWGDRMIEFHHCRSCGCTTHWSSVDKVDADRMGVNARLMAPEDLAGVPVRRFDGASSWSFLD